MKHRSKFFVAFYLCILSIQPSLAGGGMTGGATEVTQLLNNVELGLSNTQLIEQVITTKKQLETMYAELKKLQGMVSNGDDLVNTLKQLDYTVRYGQALAYTADDLAQQFSERYKDFDSFAKEFQQKNGKVDSASEAQRYQNWSRQNLDNVQSALQAAHLQSKYFQTEGQTIKEIERHAQTAEGRDQLLQAGIEVASLQAKQMVRLRELIASDVQMQANYQASQIDRQAQKDAYQAEARKPYDARDKNPNGYKWRW